MRLGDDVDRHMAIGGGKDVIRCTVVPRLAVAGARRDLADPVKIVVARRQGPPLEEAGFRTLGPLEQTSISSPRST